MKAIINLSHFFFKDLLNKRIFVVAIVVGIAFIVLSMLLGPLSFNEEKRLSINFSLAGSQISLIFLAILVGASFLKDDIETKSIHGILTRPLSRPQYYIAKVVAFVLCLLLLAFLMWSAFLLTAMLAGFRGVLVSIVPFIGIFVESLLLFSFTMFLSLFTSTFLAIGASFSLFLVGHWIPTFEHLIQHSSQAIIKLVGTIIIWVIPNLESFNWKSHLTYNEWLNISDYFQFVLYGMGWVLCITFFGVFIFNKKDFA